MVTGEVKKTGKIAHASDSSYVLWINCCNFVMSYFSAVAWQLTLSCPENQKESGGGPGQPDEGDLCVLLFRSLISTDKPVILLLTVYGIIFFWIYAFTLLRLELEGNFFSNPNALV